MRDAGNRCYIPGKSRVTLRAPENPMKFRLGLALTLVAALQLLGCGAWKRFCYEGFDRDSWQKPDQVIELLEVAEGQRIADIGAGGGYFSMRLADAVGPSGRVYAVDVDDDMIEYLQGRVADEGRENVEVVRGEFADPLLPDGEIDLVFTSNTFHHIEEQSAYFGRILRDLRPDGRVAILELNDQSFFPRTLGHMTPKSDIVQAMEGAGYVLAGDFDLVERQSFLVFERGVEK
jgi:SAM-dependent methyltransferase